MKINKDNIPEKDQQLAIDILNKLKSGVRVFGSPAEGLKKTLKELDKQAPKKDNYDSIVYNLNDSEYEAKVRKLKQGIKGEKQLAEYFEKIIRLDRELSDLIVFASLGDVSKAEEKGYIPDTDFLCIYGNDILIIDAKNIKTKPDIPLFVKGNGLFSGLKPDQPLLEINPSVYVWKDILKNEDINSIHGSICIINKTGCEIYHDNEWKHSEIKPIHISELVDFLKKWIKNKEPNYDLKTLIALANTQIKESESTIDLSIAKRIFKV